MSDFEVTSINLSIQSVIVKGNVLWTEKRFKCMSIGFKDLVMLCTLWTYDTLTEYQQRLVYYGFISVSSSKLDIVWQLIVLLSV